MSRKIFVWSFAICLFVHAGLEGAQAPRLVSRIPEDAVAAVVLTDFPALAKGKAWLSNLAHALDGEVAIALLDISREKKIRPFVVLAKVNPEKLRTFLDFRLKPIIRRNLGNVEFPSSDGVTEIVVNGSPLAFYAVKDEIFSFSLDRNVAARFISQPVPAEASLRANPLFAEVLQRAAPTSRSILFVNVKRILDTFADAIPERARGTLKAIGLLDVQAAGGYEEPVDGAQVGAFTLITSGKPGGILALYAQSPAPPATARYVPGDYSFYARYHFPSFSAAWKQLIKTLQEIPEQEAWNDISEFMGGFRDAVGLDFEKDVLGSLGGVLAVAAAVPEQLRIPDAVALLEVKNEAKVQEAIAKIIPGSGAQTQEYKGVTVRSVTIGPVTAGYAFLDGYLVAATSPSVLKSVVDTAKGGASLAENPAFRSAMARLGEGAHLYYLDVGSAAPLYLSVISRAMRGFDAQIEAISEAPDEFEPRPEPGPAGWEVTAKLLMSPFLTDVVVALAESGDEKSVTFRGYSTIKAAYNWMAASSVMAGMMLPALSRARESARRAACLNNLRQLVVAEKMYAADYDGKYTEKLSDLYPDYVTSLDVFTCPSAGGPQITRKEDIDSLTSYVLRKGLTEASPSDEVLIYESLENHRGDGGNAAFIDGHVKWMSASTLQRIIEKDEESHLPAVPPALGQAGR